jgi:hypothetical protein
MIEIKKMARPVRGKFYPKRYLKNRELSRNGGNYNCAEIYKP